MSNSKTTAELIALVEASAAFGDERDEFLSDIHAIPDLNSKVRADTIYWAYLKWKQKKDGQDPIMRKEFFKGMKKRFKNKKTRRNFYYIRSDAFNVTKEEKKQIKEYLQAEKEFYKQKRVVEARWRTLKRNLKAKKRQQKKEALAKKQELKNQRKNEMLQSTQDLTKISSQE